MADTHTRGSLVWVKDATEGWVKGVVQQVRPESVDVKVESGTITTCKSEDAPLQNPSARMGVEVCSTSQHPAHESRQMDASLELGAVEGRYRTADYRVKGRRAYAGTQQTHSIGAGRCL